MEVHEIESMIAKSEERLKQLEEKGILTTEKKSYHNGYQAALQTVLSVMKMERAYNEAIK